MMHFSNETFPRPETMRKAMTFIRPGPRVNRQVVFLTSLLCFAFLGLLSCEKEDLSREKASFKEQLIGGCGNEYFYYSADDKIYPGSLSRRIWIKFENDTITAKKAYEVLSEYDFLDAEHILDDRFGYNEAPYPINFNCT